MRGATGLLQLPLQAIVVSPQPIALPFDAFEFAAQAILFALRTLGAFTQVVVRGRLLVICACGPLRHAIVMAEPRKLYKYNFLDERVNVT